MDRPAALAVAKRQHIQLAITMVENARCPGPTTIVRTWPRAGAPHRTHIRAKGKNEPCDLPLRRSHLGGHDTALLDALVHHALGDGPPPALSRDVTPLLGGEALPAVGRQALIDAEWLVCPAWKTYAAGACPFGLLQPIIYTEFNDVPLVYSKRAPVGSCLIQSARSSPSPVAGLQPLVITPARRFASCASDFRLTVYYDGDLVAALDLWLSEP